MRSLANIISHMPRVRRTAALLMLRIADDFRGRKLNTFPQDNLFPVLNDQLLQLNSYAKMISGRTYERAVSKFVEEGILEVTRPQGLRRGNCYRITEKGYAMFKDLRTELKSLVKQYITPTETELKKFGGTKLIKEDSFIVDSNNSVVTVVDNFDQMFFDLQQEEFNKRREENRERYFARKKNTYPEKPRTSIPADFKLSEKTKEELLYIFPRMDGFYVDAGVEAIADHARHKNVQSDDWNWYIRNMIIKAYKEDWNIVKWKAGKLRKLDKEGNQDERIVADTQPGVVNSDLVQQLKEAITSVEMHRSKSASLFLIKEVNLINGKLNITFKEETAREWAAHLPGIREFITNIGYKSFAGIESVGFS